MDRGITKEFLEEALKVSVERFEVKPGSAVGDGYTCAMFSVKVYPKCTASAESPLNILVKCYPNNPMRQEFLESANLFNIELGMYQEVIPALLKFQEDAGVEEKMAPPVPEFYYGRSLDADTRAQLGRPLESLDNCIVMPDLRTPENGPFRLHDRLLPYDHAHYQLVIQAQACLHALSWAYKVKTGTSDLLTRFPYLHIQKMFESMQGMEALMAQMNKETREMFPDRADFVEAIDFMESRSKSISYLYWDAPRQEGDTLTKDNVIKVHVEPNQDEEPWLVLLHGDAWSNNHMFRYDEKTGRPVEVVFVDLQICRQGDPMCDVVYSLYSATTREFRKKHVESMLHLYYDTFLDVCKRFGVPALPGFTFPELKRRFHRTKIFGGELGINIMKTTLKSVEDIADMENLEQGSVDDLMTSIVMSGKNQDNTLLRVRVAEVLTDMIEDGIF